MAEQNKKWGTQNKLRFVEVVKNDSVVLFGGIGMHHSIPAALANPEGTSEKFVNVFLILMCPLI